LLENVRGLLSGHDGADFRAVLWELADAGYDAEWTTLRADQFGYPHRRERVFIVAHPSVNTGEQSEPGGALGRLQTPHDGGDAVLATAGGGLIQKPGRGPQGGDGPGPGGAELADAESNHRRTGIGEAQAGTGPDIERRGRPPGPSDSAGWAAILSERPWLAPAVESHVCRDTSRIPRWVDVDRRKRLKALGNAIVPACSRWIGEQILNAEANA